jgi:hypothetical protein
MKRWTFGLIAMIAALTFCTTAGAENTGEGLYSTTLSGEIVVGKQGNLELTILPAKGYKWNKDYPAKIKLPESKLVSFSKQVLKARDGDITAKDKHGVAKMVCTGTTAGTEEITATANFSVCNNETCQVLRKRNVVLNLVVK